MWWPELHGQCSFSYHVYERSLYFKMSATVDIGLLLGWMISHFPFRYDFSMIFKIKRYSLILIIFYLIIKLLRLITFTWPSLDASDSQVKVKCPHNSSPCFPQECRMAEARFACTNAFPLEERDITWSLKY